MKNQRVNRYLYVLLGISILGSVTSCLNRDIPNKNDNNSSGTSPIDIVINTPITGSVYHLSDTVFVNAKISDAANVHEFLVKIKNNTINEVALSWTEHIHSDASIVLDTFWINDVGHHSDMELTVSASDHEGNYSEKNVSFHCHPM